MYVYIAGPLTKGHRTENIRKSIDAAERIASRGHIVFVPHLWDFWELCYPGHSYEFWIQMDFQWLRKCDILVRIPGPSEGADREESLARQLGKQVFGSVLSDGVLEFMQSKIWCDTNNNSDYVSART
jgi:hypothetical protein